MITVHCWCFAYNPPANIERKLTLMKHMQTKQQLVLKFLFPLTALKRAFVVVYSEYVVLNLAKASTVYHDNTCFYYIVTEKSWPQHIQTAASASGRKSGDGNFYPPRSIYLTDTVG